MAKRLIVIYHDDFKEHSPGLVSHPERPERLDIALRSLTDIMSYVPSRRIVVKKAPRGGIDVFKRVHANAYVEQVKAILKSHRFDWLDKDTYVSKGTIKAISRLSGASRKAVMLALRGVNSFILGRPPSHHVGRSGRAMKAPSMGFCLLNTTALIASILAVHGRVTVVDSTHTMVMELKRYSTQILTSYTLIYTSTLQSPILVRVTPKMWVKVRELELRLT